jgi:hypothetical protein
MKKRALQIILMVYSFGAMAQDSMEQVIEKRARELYRVLGLAQVDDYKKFMRENYTQALLDKPVKMNRQVNDSETGDSQSSKKVDNLEAKAQMYTQLHQDFGGSTIISIKPTGNKVELVLRNPEGLTGTFTLTFQSVKPHLIEALGIQAEMEN